ncbi:MAG: hypothetical protein ACOYJO_06290 [Eubacterium sp.]
MLKHTYKEVHSHFRDGQKNDYLLILFDEPYDLLTTFFFVEVDAFADWLKEDFDNVISGKCAQKLFGGNVCTWDITPEKTTIYDGLAEDGMGNWCEVDTKELRALMDEWCQKREEFKKKYHE